MDPSLYPDPHILPTFLDNHDVRRFLYITTPTGEDLLQALAFLFTVPGIPVIYYGTEQGFTETRQAMFAGGYRQPADAYDTAGAVYQRIKKLAELRRARRVFTRGGLEVLADTVAGPGPFAYRRTDGAESVVVVFNTSAQPALLAEMDTRLPAGSTLEVLHDERSPPAAAIGAGGRMTMVLPPKAALIARPTGQTTTPPAPAATITVTTPIAGQTFREDTTFRGTVTPPATRLQMVLDGSLAAPTDVTVAGDGTWSVTLPVSSFPTGSFQHDVAFYAPEVKVATPSARFTTEVVFVGETHTFSDPAGDDRGPNGLYTYPADQTFRRQMDLREVKLEVGVTTMNLNLTMTDVTSVWNPRHGFDHVYFNIYFGVPGGAEPQTAMPRLSGRVPEGFAWHFNQFSGGFDNVMYTSRGASATQYGSPSVAPTVRVDAGQKTIIFTYDRNHFGVPSWSGVKIYVSTWDFDGIGAVFRPLTKDGGQWRMGGGGPPYTPDATDPSVLYSNDPKIMDDLPVITIP
jgi:hypothetical protein